MATVRADWQMPEPPVPGAIPAFYNDCGEMWLHWGYDENGEYLPVEEEGIEIDIRWPFNEKYAKNTELEAIGFINVDP